MNDEPPSTSILFVCLGNICRSPLAEGIFVHLARERGVEARVRVDSAGTGGWHVGDPPDPRSVEVARRNGIDLPGRARRVRAEDFGKFDLILAMDRSNLTDLERLRGAAAGRAELRLFRDFDPEAKSDLDVPDPYYGGPSGFDDVFAMVRRTCEGLLEELAEDGWD